MKDILLINSKKIASESIGILIEELEVKGNNIFELTKKINQNRNSKSAVFGFEVKTNIQSMLFFVMLPCLRIYHGLKFRSLAKKRGFNRIVCFGINEKIIYAKLAKKMNIKCSWIFFPDDNVRVLPKLIQKVLKKNSEGIEIFTLNSLVKNALNNIDIKENIQILPLCVKNKFIRQGTIFENIAQNEHPNYNRRYFTIGTFNNLVNAYQIEILLQAVQKSLELIPDIQLIVIGEGPEKKNMTWAAKKMGISNFVWFIGRNNNTKKWFNSFDVYINSNDHTDIHEYENTIKAMSAGLPVIGYAEKGLEDLIKHKQTGMLTTFNHADLVETIAYLQQNKKFCDLLGKQAGEFIDKTYNPANMIGIFNKNL